MAGWRIDRDYLAEPGEKSRVGYGQTDGEKKAIDDAAENPFYKVVHIRQDIKAKEITDPIRFRVLDDDGEVYYGGVISREWLEGEELYAFGPLNFATVDAGATELQYRSDEKPEEWTTL